MKDRIGDTVPVAGATSYCKLQAEAGMYMVLRICWEAFPFHSAQCMSLSDFYVTGISDTGIGKTFVSCILLHMLRGRGQRAVGMKPVASGCAYSDTGWRNECSSTASSQRSNACLRSD